MATVTLEARSDGWSMAVRDLSALEAALGSEAYRLFCCCFILADRIQSLISFVEPVLKRRDQASNRDFVTFYVLLLGTLYELGRHLGNLRKALNKRNLLDKSAWKRNLGRWEALAAAQETKTIRNKVCFHLDPGIVSDGLKNVRSTGSTGKVELFLADGRSESDVHFAHGSDVLFRGLDLRVRGVLRFVTGPARRLGIQRALQSEFVRAIESAGVEVIRVRVRRSRS